MRGSRALAPVVLAVLAATPAAAVAPGPAVDLGGPSGAARCLRATGAPGQLLLQAPRERGYATDVRQGLDVTGTVRLGLQIDCAEGAAGGGRLVVAAPVLRARTPAIRAQVLPDGPVQTFAVPARTVVDGLQATAGPDGSVAIGWIETRQLGPVDRAGEARAARVRVARAPAGGPLGAAASVLPSFRAKDLDVGRTAFDLAQAPDGATLVAALQPQPSRRGEEGTLRELTRLVLRRAPAGGAFAAPQVLAPDRQDATVGLSVAPDGSALVVSGQNDLVVDLWSGPADGALRPVLHALSRERAADVAEQAAQEAAATRPGGPSGPTGATGTIRTAAATGTTGTTAASRTTAATAATGTTRTTAATRTTATTATTAATGTTGTTAPADPAGPTGVPGVAADGVPQVLLPADPSEPAVAAAPGGAGVLAYRLGAHGAGAVTLSAGAIAGVPRTAVAPETRPTGSGGGLFGLGEYPTRPDALDEELDPAPRIALAADGRFSLGLLTGFEPLTVRSFAATGTLDGGVEPAAALASRVRAPTGLAAYLDLDGAPQVAAADEAGGSGLADETRAPSARLSRTADAADTAVATPAPEAQLLVARRLVIRDRERTPVRVRCSAACDVRLHSGGHRFDSAVSGASFPTAGVHVLMLDLAGGGLPGHTRDVKLTLEASAPRGVAVRSDRRAVTVQVRKLLPSPTVRSARATVRGRRVRVTFRLPADAPRYAFFASVDSRDEDRFPGYGDAREVAPGRFVATLTLPRHPADDVRLLGVSRGPGRSEILKLVPLPSR